MKLNLIHKQEALTCAAVGAAGALIFLFAFPKGSISTLVHAILNLPGPGAGIALMLGPFLILVAIVSALLSQGSGGAVVASLIFAVTYALVVWLLEVSTNPKGAFGSPLFVAAIAQLGIVADVVMALGKGLKPVWRCILSGAVANAVLLIFYWTAIFPRTARWVDWSDIPFLMGLCLACGLASGWIAWGLSRPLSRALRFKQKE